jgi:hypothetical protein
MAAARHNLSRRAVLGAGVGLCVAPGAAAALAAEGQAPLSPFRPGPDPGLSKAVSLLVGDRPLHYAWGQALARFRRAEAALAECRTEQAALPEARRAWPHSQALDDRFGALDDIRLAALRRLLRTRVPDLAALALKIDLSIDDRAWELSGGEACLARLRADAWSLADGG